MHPLRSTERYNRHCTCAADLSLSVAGCACAIGQARSGVEREKDPLKIPKSLLPRCSTWQASISDLTQTGKLAAPPRCGVIEEANLIRGPNLGDTLFL